MRADQPSPMPPHLAPSAEPAPARPAGAPYIRVLGPVEVVGVSGPVDVYRTGQLTRVAAYIALFPGRSGHQMELALWGAGTREATRCSAISRLRRWLAADPSGAWFLPRAAGPAGEYTLHRDVTTDWDQFRSLIDGGIHDCSTTALRAALSLVNGPLLSGGAPGDYDWAAPVRAELSHAVVTVAGELVRRALGVGDVPTAAAAVAIVRNAEPDPAALARLAPAEIALAHARGDVLALGALLRRQSEAESALAGPAAGSPAPGGPVDDDRVGVSALGARNAARSRRRRRGPGPCRPPRGPLARRFS